MKVELGSIQSTKIERFNGGEGFTEASMYVDAKGNRVLRGRLPPGSSIGLHRHVGSMETIFILSGTGRAVCDGVEEELAPGDCHICPEGSEHCLVNDGGQDLTFIAVVPKLG